MMSDIDVIVYSYKGKFLKDTLRYLYNNASGKRKINVIIIDQHPLNRHDLFVNEFDCKYVHVFWDWQYGPCLYKHDMLSFVQSKYVMLISDNIALSRNWDDDLVDFVGNENKIVSGNMNVKFSNKNIFYIEKHYTETKTFKLNNFIDRNLIFGLTTTIRSVKYPKYLKYNGEEETLSLEYYTKEIEIYNAPTSIYEIKDEPTLENLYIPFSINHNYNEVVKLLQDGINKYTDIRNRNKSLKDFCIFHNFNFSNLKLLPFQTNDVEYDPQNLNFNKVDARKFVARTKAIH